MLLLGVVIPHGWHKKGLVHTETLNCRVNRVVQTSVSSGGGKSRQGDSES